MWTLQAFNGADVGKPTIHASAVRIMSISGSGPPAPRLWRSCGLSVLALFLVLSGLWLGFLAAVVGEGGGGGGEGGV